MRTLKYNGEQWYYDERSLWKRVRQWVIWIGGWEKPNGTGWEFTINYCNKRAVMSPTPVSLFGHFVTFFKGWMQVRLIRFRHIRWYLTINFKRRYAYISNDGTPPRDERNKGFYLIKGKYYA